MTQDEQMVLTYLVRKGDAATDSMIQNQCGLTAAALGPIMRSLKRALLVEQEGRLYRALKAAEEALQPRPPQQPFAHLQW